MVLQFDVVEQSFSEDVSDSNETVIFLGLIEWIILAAAAAALG